MCLGSSLIERGVRELHRGISSHPLFIPPLIRPTAQRAENMGAGPAGQDEPRDAATSISRERKKGRPGNLLAPRRVWHIRPSSPERGPPTSAIPVKGRSGVELAEKPHAQNFHQWQFHLLFWRRRRRAFSNRVKVGGRVETDRTIRTTAWWWLVSVWANACFWAFSFRPARPSIHTPAYVSTCKRTFVDLQ